MESDIKFYLSHQDLSANDLIELTLFDAMNELAGMFERGGCITSAHCNKTCTECRLGMKKSLDALEVAHHKRLTVLLFPLFVLQSLGVRCPSVIGIDYKHRLEKIQNIIKKYYLYIANLNAEDCPAKAPVAQALPNNNDSPDIYEKKVEAVVGNVIALFEKFAETYRNLPREFESPVREGIAEARDDTRRHFSPTEISLPKLISDSIQSEVNSLRNAGCIPIVEVREADRANLVRRFSALRQTLQRLAQNDNSQNDLNEAIKEANDGVNSIEQILVSAANSKLDNLYDILIWPVYIVSGYME